MQLYQGDVAIIAISEDKLPKDLQFKLLPKVGQIVAYGETTGHTHTVVAEREAIVEMAQDQFGYYFKVKQGQVVMNHQMHKSQVLTPQIWFVANQFEYDEIQELRRVQD